MFNLVILSALLAVAATAPAPAAQSTYARSGPNTVLSTYSGYNHPGQSTYASSGPGNVLSSNSNDAPRRHSTYAASGPGTVLSTNSNAAPGEEATYAASGSTVHATYAGALPQRNYGVRSYPFTYNSYDYS